MIFLIKDDFDQIMRLDVLDNITESDDSKLDTEEEFAMAKIGSFLGERYDLEAEYLLLGAQRNRMLIRAVMQLMLFALYQRRSSNDVPDHIYDGKEYVEKWLKGVRDGKLSTSLAIKDEELGSQELFLSEPNRNYSRRF